MDRNEEIVLDCVICSGECADQIESSQSSQSVSINFLREVTDVYTSEELSESLCELLHLPSETFRDRILQENIHFCKSCALATQELHALLVQLKTLQLQVNGFKNEFDERLRKNSRFRDNEESSVGSNLTPTLSLRNDIHELAFLNESSTCTVRVVEEPPLFGTINHPKTTLTSETVDEVFQPENFLYEDSSEADNVSSWFQPDLDPLALSSPEPSSSRISRRKTKRPVRQPKKFQQDARPKKKRATSKSKTLNEMPIDDLTAAVESAKRIGTRASARRKLNDDSTSVLGFTLQEEEERSSTSSSEEWHDRSPSESPKRKTHRLSKRRRPSKKPNLVQYLLCMSDGCTFKAKYSDDKGKDEAEIRLHNHIKKIHERLLKPFTCKECSKVFSTRQQQKVHARVHTGDSPYVCEFCGKSFRAMHLLKVHSSKHTRTENERKFECKLCSNKFYTATTLHSHMLTHTQDRSFICELCSSAFLRKLDLTNHQRYAHSEAFGVEQFKCKFCNKPFLKKLTLITHEKTHTNDGEHQCSQCNYRSHLKSKVTAHEKAHNLERKFKCDFENCDKSYKHEFQLVIHKRIHTGERPFKCNVCENSYKAHSHLYVHQQTHGDLKHKCSFCGQGFTLVKYLLRHEDRHKAGKLKKRWKRPAGVKTEGELVVDEEEKCGEGLL